MCRVVDMAPPQGRFVKPVITAFRLKPVFMPESSCRKIRQTAPGMAVSNGNRNNAVNIPQLREKLYGGISPESGIGCRTQPPPPDGRARTCIRIRLLYSPETLPDQPVMIEFGIQDGDGAIKIDHP